MNTMNLATTTATENRADDLTTLSSRELEAWFADAGLSVTEVAHCASASCPVCFPLDLAEGSLAA